MFLKKLIVILRLGDGKKYKNELGFKSNRVDINMSFFWFSEPKSQAQPKATVRKTVDIQPTPVVTPSPVLEPECCKVESHRQVEHEREHAHEYEREPEPELRISQPEPEVSPFVSTRSVPTADAFTQVHITHRPKKRVDLTVEIPVCKSVSISDACTPVLSAYNSPRYDVQFQREPEPENPYEDLWPCSEPCTPTSASTRRSEEEFKLQTTIHHLENLFRKGLYHHVKAVHQGVFKDTVLHGGHVAAPDREDLDARENIHLFTPTSRNQVIEIQHKYVELVAESRKFHERLEVLTGQLGDLTLNF